VSERFVPLKLHLFESTRAVIRPLNVIWTPTILIADRRMAVHYRSLNFLPPRHFLTLLDIGEAELDLRWSRTQRAIELLARAYERDPDGPLAAEALYRRGIAVYLLTHSNEQMYAIWDILRERLPDSIWAARVP
jgi:tetratricopeptide (TPR) repeat protein